MYYWQWTRRGFFSELSLLIAASYYAKLENQKFYCDFFKAKLGGEKFNYFVDMDITFTTIPLLWYRNVFQHDSMFDKTVNSLLRVRYGSDFLPHNALFKVLWHPEFESELYSRYSVNQNDFFEYFQECWKLTDVVTSYVKGLEEDLGILPGYMSIHVRRGDKLISEAKMCQIEAYFNDVNLDDFNTLFVATDDISVIDEVRSFLANKNIRVIHNVSLNELGHSQGDFNSLSKKDQRDSIIKLLAEVEILRKSDVFIGSYSSNIGRFIHILRNGTKSYSVDGDYRWFYE